MSGRRRGGGDHPRRRRAGCSRLEVPAGTRCRYREASMDTTQPRTMLPGFTASFHITDTFLSVWFKNRRAKWRKQKREEQERLRKLQEERGGCRAPPPRAPASPPRYSDHSDSDLEVA
ncbi:unnamed protein product [Plutella xylostella]|uniref:(diamondback moth) hypothetical protein n=1 Tax=Plutella xylostella TaxID=51655 RepID=A0A8S4EGF3_PLUXY|nr:unnamed protein product [Plutella xylostella]